jgi:hypothetical protein
MRNRNPARTIPSSAPLILLHLHWRSREAGKAKAAKLAKTIVGKK